MSNFTLKDLPYGKDSLEPYIDTQTMTVHHDNHHAGYVAKLNAAVASEQVNLGLMEILESAASVSDAIRNNAGGHYNHSLFWNIMTAEETRKVNISSTLEEKIIATFGSVEEMMNQFTAAALGVFGSGWVWLGVKDGALQIASSVNQNNPLMKGIGQTEMIPIMGLDVWEHAYYLKYKNKRQEYVENWWNVVDWETVSVYYDDYAVRGVPVVFE